jgi:hypothetical protein
MSTYVQTHALFSLDLLSLVALKPCQLFPHNPMVVIFSSSSKSKSNNKYKSPIASLEYDYSNTCVILGGFIDLIYAKKLIDILVNMVGL